MNDNQRSIMYELKSQGLNTPEISRELGVSLSTINSYLRRHPAPPGMIACKQCGKLIPLTPGRKKRVFCSDKCRHQWWNSRRYGEQRNLIVKSCACCGKEFVSYASDNRKYCSTVCYHNARRSGGNAQDCS